MQVQIRLCGVQGWTGGIGALRRTFAQGFQPGQGARHIIKFYYGKPSRTNFPPVIQESYQDA